MKYVFSRCGFLSAAVWGILAFRIVETVFKPFTLFHSKWETKLRYQGQLNHPTPRMTKTLLCCISPHVPWAPLHPTISSSLKRKRICYSFILFKIVCHFSMVTSQKHHYTNKPIYLNIHSLLRILQYLWHGRVIRSQITFAYIMQSNVVSFYYLWYGATYKRQYTDKTLTLRKSL